MSANQYVSIPEAVDWRQGMLISPQHFQQQEIYIDRLTSHKLYLSQPHYWGLIDIRLREDLLESDKIRITRLHAVLPDGQVIDFDEENGDPGLLADIPAGQVDDTSENSGLLVSVGVFRRGAKADGGEEQNLQRFESVSFEDIADENNPNQLVDMRKKRVMVQLFFGDKTNTRFVTTPLFKVASTQKGYRLTSYHPPMLDVSVSRTLLGKKSICVKLESALRSIRLKAKDLAAVSSAGSDSDLTLVSMMLAKVPALEVLLDMKMVHPFQLYMAFIDLLASLAASSIADKPFSPEGYVHDHPERGFFRYLSYLAQRIDSVRSTFHTHIFTRSESGYFEMDLPDDVDVKELILRLIPEQGQHSDVVLHWIKTAKIGSDKQMPSLEKGRIYGLQRAEMEEGQRESMRLPVSGAIVTVSGDQKGSRIPPKSRLQVIGDARGAPEKIYLCVPQSKSNG